MSKNHTDDNNMSQGADGGGQSDKGSVADILHVDKYMPTERNVLPLPRSGAPMTDNELRQEFFNTTTTSLNEDTSQEKNMKISCNGCGQKLDVSTLDPFSKFECPVCGAELIVPRWFDEYMLIKVEGMGGMATVYRAIDPTLDREIAVKILNPEVALDKERGELFLNEARTAATINNPSVVPIYTCGEFKGQPFIVMQFMKGGSLEELIDVKNPPDILCAVKWFRSVAEGLYCAYRHGIVHHDIKPGNIMLDNADYAKIGDFGIAQAINDSRASKIFEMTKSWISPHYVSPEKAVSNREDYRGDIYSLGAAFYHILTGFTPFQHDDIEELIRLRLVKIPQEPKRRRRAIPSELSKLIMGMLSINPLNRPEYPQIIAELDSISVRLEAKRKKQLSKKSIQRRWIMTRLGFIAAILLVWLGVIWCAYRLSGDVEPVELDITSGMIDRRIRETAELFATGDSKRATVMSKSLFDSANIAPKTRKYAALQLALGNYLNCSRYAPDNCAFIAGRLIEIGIRPTSPVIAMIRFLEKKEISPADLRNKLTDSNAWQNFVCEYVIFIRSVYFYEHGEETYENVMENLRKLKSVSEHGNLQGDSYADCWRKRLPVYENILNNKHKNGVMVEPLFDRLRFGAGENKPADG